jgi:hypothetical protein
MIFLYNKECVLIDAMRLAILGVSVEIGIGENYIKGQYSVNENGKIIPCIYIDKEVLPANINVKDVIYKVWKIISPIVNKQLFTMR